MNKNLKGHLAALLAVCIWSTSGVSYTVVRNYLSPLEIILLGIGLSFTLLNFLHLPRMHQKKKINELWFILAGVLGVSVYFYLEYSALVLTSRGSVSVIMMLVPVFSSILCMIFFKSGNNPARFYTGFAFCAVGAFLITFFENGGFYFDLTGALYALGAAICLAAFFAVVKKCTTLVSSSIQLVRRVFFWGMIALAPLCLVLEFDPFSYTKPTSLPAILNLLLVCLVTPTVCYLGFAYSIRNIGVKASSSYIYVMPVASVILSAILEYSGVSPYVLIGVVLSVVGITLSTKK